MLTSLKVKDFMTTKLETCSPKTNIFTAINALTTKSISGMTVINQEGGLLGHISEYDCLKVALQSGYYDEGSGIVEDFMTRNLDTVEADASILDVAELFINKSRKRFPVLEFDKLIGQISRSDILRAIQKNPEVNWPDN